MDPEVAEAVEHLAEATEHVVEQLQGLEDALAAAPVPVVQPAAGWFLWTLKFLAKHGYLLAFLGAFGESTAVLGAILPGGSVVVLSGIAARSGGLSLPLLVGLSAAGMVLGAVVNYLVGRIGYGWLPAESRLGQRLRRELDHAGVVLSMHGWWAMTVAYLFGPGRSVLSLAAGAGRMPPGRFLCIQIPAALLWSTIYAGGAYMLAGEWRTIERILYRAGWAGTAGAIAAVAVWWVLRRRVRARAVRGPHEQRPRDVNVVLPPGL
jgi:membrane protein DedA with SNARE-associated domain